jgi:molecular chaperone HtpG
MTTESGHISIHADNILPIIKRWLYSEKEIFIRELVSNAADAITKLQKLATLGEVKGEVPEAKIAISIDRDAKLLKISDTGLGMTADEVKKYINQVAFSGVTDFVKKYEGKADEQQIIGHFGLGFYSAYMVASKVEIDTLSFQEGAEAVHWECDGSTEFTLSPSPRTSIGTTITLHISEDSKEMLEESHVRGLLERYCAFVRYLIELAGQVVNDPQPLWTKSPSQISDKEYIDFFHKLFPMSPDPLFWVHLNVDHPFNLKGILYFPKLRHELDASQGQVKLYCNQVYVADNCKELIPDFLTLLRGAIDCPDLPLNVSRSYLQNDPHVQRITDHIIKKVADRLTGMAKTDLDTYKKYWDDIQPFVKFGMLREPKFYDRMVNHLLFHCASGEFISLDQYLEKCGKVTKDYVIYTSDQKSQSTIVKTLEAEGVDVVIADKMIDQHFLPFVEMHSGRKYKFKRVDADLSEILINASAPDLVDPVDQKKSSEKLADLFNKYLGKERVKVKVENFKSASLPALLQVDENMRRLREMARMSPLGDGANPWQDEATLLVNQNSPAVKGLLEMARGFNKEEDLKLAVEHVYDLAYLQQGQFDAEGMRAFIDRSARLLERLGQSSQQG